MPKGYRKNIRLTKDKEGLERRQEMLDEIADKGTFLPKGIHYEDMDKSFLDFAKDDITLTVEGEEVPVLFLTIQRWSEFTQTWGFADKYKNLKMPFITVVRKPDVQVGTNQNNFYNIPGKPTFTYMKVPTWEGGRKGVDVYKIPQPTAVDVNYEVRLFCNRMRDLNKFHNIMQKTFNSRQHYINVNGHPMPLHLESISDQSNVSDLDSRRYYVQFFEIKLLGYILDEEDFEVVSSVNRMVLFNELGSGPTKKKKKQSDIEVSYNIVFNSVGINSYTLTSGYNTRFDEVLNQNNIDTLNISISGNPQTLPFVANVNTEITFGITRTVTGDTASFDIKGIKV
jgi:hypothetical protein